MTDTIGWRRLLTCATIDLLLILAAGGAVAAPIGATTVTGTPALPSLLLLGFGLCTIPRWRH